MELSDEHDYLLLVRKRVVPVHICYLDSVGGHCDDWWLH